MTSAEANSLHNPFLWNGKLRRDLQIFCDEQPPDRSRLVGNAVILTFPTQDWVDLVSSDSSITALFLDRPKANDLSGIANLTLSNLTISYPKPNTDWSFLGNLPSLIRLSLQNTIAIQDIDWVRSLSALEVFQLSGGYSKALQLLSLAPLADAHHLTAILLASIRCTDWSLRTLFNLASLRRFDCPLWWPQDEVRALAEYNKHLKCNVIEEG